VERAAPPQFLRETKGFNAAVAWSASGALAAGFAIGLYVLITSHTLWQADLALTVGWAIFALLGVIVLFWPFLLSWLCYFPMSRLRVTQHRAAGAAFGALWHLGAQCAVVNALGGYVSSWMMLVPVIVGGVWGSWLPASTNQ
jgi:hypothetical protein